MEEKKEDPQEKNGKNSIEFSANFRNETNIYNELDNSNPKYISHITENNQCLINKGQTEEEEEDCLFSNHDKNEENSNEQYQDHQDLDQEQSSFNISSNQNNLLFDLDKESSCPLQEMSSQINQNVYQDLSYDNHLSYASSNEPLLNSSQSTACSSFTIASSSQFSPGNRITLFNFYDSEQEDDVQEEIVVHSDNKTENIKEDERLD